MGAEVSEKEGGLRPGLIIEWLGSRRYDNRVIIKVLDRKTHLSGLTLGYCFGLSVHAITGFANQYWKWKGMED